MKIEKKLLVDPKQTVPDKGLQENKLAMLNHIDDITEALASKKVWWVCPRVSYIGIPTFW